MKFDIGFATLYALCYGEGVSRTEGGGGGTSGGERLSLSRAATDQNHPTALLSTSYHPPSILPGLHFNAPLPLEAANKVRLISNADLSC